MIIKQSLRQRQYSLRFVFKYSERELRERRLTPAALSSLLTNRRFFFFASVDYFLWPCTDLEFWRLLLMTEFLDVGREMVPVRGRQLDLPVGRVVILHGLPSEFRFQLSGAQSGVDPPAHVRQRFVDVLPVDGRCLEVRHSVSGGELFGFFGDSLVVVGVDQVGLRPDEGKDSPVREGVEHTVLQPRLGVLQGISLRQIEDDHNADGVLIVGFGYGPAAAITSARVIQRRPLLNCYCLAIKNARQPRLEFELLFEIQRRMETKKRIL